MARRSAFGALMVVAALISGACSSSAASSAPASGAASPAGEPSEAAPSAASDIFIGASVWVHVPWLDSYGQSLEKLGQENGVKVSVSYSDANAQTQSSQIDSLLAQNPDAIIFTGVDPSADNAILARIKAAGVITVGGIIEPTQAGLDIVDAYRGPNDFTHGKLGAESLAKALEGQSGDIAIVRGDPGGTDNINRAIGFTDRLKELRPDLKIVADQDSSFGDEKIPYDVTTAILAANPNIIGIFTEADTIANAAAKAVADAGLTGKVTVVGVGGSCEGFDGVKAGTIYSTTLQDPPIGAQDVFAAAMALIKGESIEKIQYMDLPVVTKDNVADYECHW